MKPMAVNVGDLTRLSQEHLDELFRQSPAGRMPEGDAAGTALIAPGSAIAGIAKALAELLIWQGKRFDARRGEVLNRISPLGLWAIKAKVYRAPSWFDNQEAIILDYSKTSLVASRVRDEIREIAPGTYLGRLYWGRTRLVGFTLVLSRPLSPP